MQHDRSSRVIASVGVVFALLMLFATDGWGAKSDTILHRFAGGSDGGGVYAGLVSDGLGSFYGTTVGGGSGSCSGGCGTVFKLTPDSNNRWHETVVHSFAGIDGSGPEAGLILDAGGSLYGTTYYGGDLSQCGGSGCGVVFKISPGSTGYQESVLYSFIGSTDGQHPMAELAIDAAGHVYGTTVTGGAYKVGVVFELTYSGGKWSEKVIHHFTGGKDGSSPIAGVILDHSGNIYGAAIGAGAFSSGVVFRLTQNSNGDWKETVLHAFTGSKDGAEPLSVILDASGNIYGTTLAGGDAACQPGFGCGTVFKLTAKSRGWHKTLVHLFKGGRDGISPQGTLVLDSAGNLYGTTVSGGSDADCAGNGPTGCGTVFELTSTANHWKEFVLHRFLGQKDGVYPLGGVILDTTGNLYGTTAYGGGSTTCKNDGCGTAFRLMPNFGDTKLDQHFLE